MKFQEFIIMCISLLVIGPLQSAEANCLDRFMDMSLLKSRASRIGEDRPGGIEEMDNEIQIMGNIQFTCDTVTQIDSVLLGIDIRYMMNNRNKYPSVQLWRPTGVGETIELASEQMIVYTPANVSNTGVYQYPLTTPLNAIAGDYLAISQPKQSESIVRVYTVDVQSGSSYKIGLGATTLDIGGSSIENKLVLLYPISSQPSCITSTVNESYVREQSLLIAESKDVKDKRQFFYPDMKFMCNGRINKWIYAGTSGSSIRIPELQVWRLSTGFTDTYTKIGSSQVIVNEIGMNSNIHELSVDPPIEFMEGDVFGLHQPDKDMTTFYLHSQKDSGPKNMRFDFDTPLANFALSTFSEDKNDYPLVALEILQYDMTSTISSSSSQSVSYATIAAIITTSQYTTSMLVPSGVSITGTVTHGISISDGPVPPSLSTSTTVHIRIKSSQINSSRPPTTSTIYTVDVKVNDTSSASITNNSSAGFIGAMVTIVLLIVIAIVCTVIVVAVLIWRRKVIKINGDSTVSSKQSGSSYHEGPTLSNPVYGSGDTSSIAKNRYKDLEILSPPINGGCSATGRSTILNDTEPNLSNPIYSEVNEDRHFQPSINQDNCQHYEWNIVVPTLDERMKITSSYKEFREAVSSQYMSTKSTQYDNTYQFLESVPGNFFEESNIYWAPGSDYGSLYEQLSSRKFREILSSHVSMSTLLGSGQFGVVMKGTWTSPDGVTPVAIKTVKQNAVEEEKVKFLQEAAIMGQFHHPNIIKIHGVVTMTEPTMIVLELMNDGDLHSYLKQLKPSPGEMVDHSIPELLLSFCRQVASAMDYLASKSFIHRDIAARNVLVTDKKTCKISDFGMSRDLQEENYYISKGGQIPIKWTAPEALSYKKYSTASDVWSYGVLMYEIWSLGSKPFQSFTNQQAFRKVCDGYRLPPPPGCPRPLYEMMIKCWNPEYALRPSFSTLMVDVSQKDHKLLEVCPPSNGNPQACVLGAPIEAGQELYLELQALYRS